MKHGSYRNEIRKRRLKHDYPEFAGLRQSDAEATAAKDDLGGSDLSNRTAAAVLLEPFRFAGKTSAR